MQNRDRILRASPISSTKPSWHYWVSEGLALLLRALLAMLFLTVGQQLARAGQFAFNRRAVCRKSLGQPWRGCAARRLGDCGGLGLYPMCLIWRLDVRPFFLEGLP
jgi:hypothetical protein